MNLLVVPSVWQKTAQNDLGSISGFSQRNVWSKLASIASVSSRTPACTTQYRYPSPSKRFGSFWAGPFFFAPTRPAIEQKTAENRAMNSGDSFGIHTLLYLPAIKTIGGRKQCRSNIWPLLPFLSRRLPAVWTMTSSALPLAPLQAPLSWKLRAAVCLPERSSVPAQARFATMLACATKLTNTLRSRLYPSTTREKKTTVGLALRWLFYVWATVADLAHNLAKTYELARARKWRVGSEKTGAVRARTILGKAS